MDQGKRTDRLSHIDSIRGVAAVAVVYFHAGEHALKTGMYASAAETAVFVLLSDWFNLGKIAVLLFFGVSGFVIPFSINGTVSAGLRRFAISRFFRLYPAYWVSIVAAVYFLYMRHDVELPAHVIAVNATMTQQFVGVPNIIQLYWTLQIELIFYVICASLFFLGILSSVKTIATVVHIFIAVALAMSVARYFSDIKLPIAVPLALTMMFIGYLLRLSQDGVLEAKKILKRSTFYFILAIPVIAVLAYNRDFGFNETWYKYTIAYYAALFLFFMLTTRWRITGRFFVYLGSVSYSIYLFGPIAQDIVLTNLLPHLPPAPAHLWIVCVLILTVVIAHTVFHLVERPGIALGRSFAKMRRPVGSTSQSRI